MRKFFEEGKNLLNSKQTNIISAATIIMVMILASRLLGVLRNRIYVHYFAPGDLGVFLAAFSLPDTIFEVLTNGIMASAFIPVFTKYLHKKDKMEAWYVSSITLNILLLFFAVFSILILLFTRPVYNILTPGFTEDQLVQVVNFARIFLVAQMFFSASYLLGAILETHQRFIISSIAPLFYNLGIILTTIFFAPQIGLYAPVIGVVVGAAAHFLIQLPFAVRLGFRPVFSLDFRDRGVREIGKLAAPRLLELVFLRVKNFVDLFIAATFGGAGVTYFRFGDALTSLPTALFALSIAKASLPQLSQLAVAGKMPEYKRTFAESFKEILFLVLPISVFIAVLRLPIVRLTYGDAQFDWESTLMTGYVVSAFSLGIFSYSLVLLVTRAFYALQDTKTPVTITIMTIIINAILGLVFLFYLHLPVWGLPLSSSIAGMIQIIAMMTILSRKVGGFAGYDLEKAFGKIIIASGTAGIIMFAFLKLLDRAAVDKNLWLLGLVGLRLPTTFDKFLLDTHYTVNVIILTAGAGFVGILLYLGLCYILKVEELRIVARAIKLVSNVGLRLPFFTKVENKDYTNLASQNDGSPPNAQLNIPNQSNDQTTFNLSSFNQTTDKVVTLSNPRDRETLTAIQPEFSGTGTPKLVFTITVQSSVITDTITILNNGTWKWTPPTPLELGNHTVTLSWKDSSGQTQTLKRTFKVVQTSAPAVSPSPAGGAVLISSPVPSPIPSPSPSPKISPSPSIKPSPSPSPQISPSPKSSPQIATASGSVLPSSGSLTLTFGIFIMGLIFLFMGLLFPTKKKIAI